MAGLESLKNYIEKNEFRGYDPYDALSSPLFKLPIFRSNKLIRFGAQQFVKRSPINVRPLLFVPKGLNPVTLGLCIQGYAYLYLSEHERQDEYRSQILKLTEELMKLIPQGFSGACWGYDFDWEARHAKIPAYQPTVVATGIIINALHIANEAIKDERLSALIVSAADFVTNDLNRTQLGEGLCFSYSPTDHQQVFNASMKGVRVLAQAYAISKNEALMDLAQQAVKFVADNQRADGSWVYSLAKSGGWVDNYHTGYVLDCLSAYQQLSGRGEGLREVISKGYSYYVQNFIEENGMPKFYNNKACPVDCTAAAQTILTTIRFDDVRLATKVCGWMTDNMQKKNGSFAFRKYRTYTEKTSFMRWSDAWMFAAMSNLNYVLR